MGPEVLLAAPHELEDQQVIEQRPGLLHDHLTHGPVVVAQLEGLLEHGLGHVDGAPGASGVEGLVRAGMVEHQQVRPVHQGDADVLVEQRVHQIGRQMPHRSVEELHQVVAGVQPLQPFVGQVDAVAQPRLLPEDHRLVAGPQHLVDLGVGNVPFAQTGVGPRVAAVKAVHIVDLEESVVHGSARRRRPVPRACAGSSVLSVGSVMRSAAGADALPSRLPAHSHCSRTWTLHRSRPVPPPCHPGPGAFSLLSGDCVACVAAAATACRSVAPMVVWTRSATCGPIGVSADRFVRGRPSGSRPGRGRALATAARMDLPRRIRQGSPSLAHERAPGAACMADESVVSMAKNRRCVEKTPGAPVPTGTATRRSRP